MVTFRNNTTLKRIGHFQSWSDRKKLTRVKWKDDCCHRINSRKINQKWIWMLSNFLEWRFCQQKWTSDGRLQDWGAKKTQWSCSFLNWSAFIALTGALVFILVNYRSRKPTFSDFRFTKFVKFKSSEKCIWPDHKIAGSLQFDRRRGEEDVEGLEVERCKPNAR